MTKKEQFDKLFRANKTTLYNVAFSVTKNRESAEDVLLDSFIKAWKKFDQYDATKKFGNWMTTIVKNTAIDHNRKNQKKSNTMSFDNLVSTNNNNKQKLTYYDVKDKNCDLAKNLERQESLDLLNNTIRNLPEELQIVMIPFVENYSYNEISESTSLTVATVRARVHKAKKILRQTLKYENFANF